jgi:hypothetical protein
MWGHALFVAFLVLGGLAVLRWPVLAWIHLPMVIYGGLIEFIGFNCPLTTLEVSLRRKAGQPGYDGGCIEHYSRGVFPKGVGRKGDMLLGAGVVALNVVVYAVVLLR